MLLLGGGLWVASGSPWPTAAGWHEHLWLGASGLVGLVSAWFLLSEHLGSLARGGMVHLAPLPATLLRMFWATAGLVLLSLVTRCLGPTLAALRDRKNWPAMAGGVVVGPVLGV